MIENLIKTRTYSSSNSPAVEISWNHLESSAECGLTGCLYSVITYTIIPWRTHTHTHWNFYVTASVRRAHLFFFGWQVYCSGKFEIEPGRITKIIFWLVKKFSNIFRPTLQSTHVQLKPVWKLHLSLVWLIICCNSKLARAVASRCSGSFNQVTLSSLADGVWPVCRGNVDVQISIFATRLNTGVAHRYIQTSLKNQLRKCKRDSTFYPEKLQLFHLLVFV